MGSLFFTSIDSVSESFDLRITMHWADVDPIMTMWTIKAKIATDPLYPILFEFTEHVSSIFYI